jgi:hypothetical protein
MVAIGVTAFHVVTGFSTNLLRINSKPQITCDPNHAVGEVYKPQTLRVHDPDGLYAWEERVPVWVWVMRALGALGFMVGIYCLVFLGMLF